MLSKLKESWKRLMEEEPGRRFQEAYRRKNSGNPNPFKKPLLILGGLILFVLGLAMLALPGPGLLVSAVGAVIVAQQSKVAAKALDAAEVWGRKWMAELNRFWMRLALPWKILLALLIAVIAVAAGGRLIWKFVLN